MERDCSKCGCNDTELVFNFGANQCYECNFCAHRFVVGPESTKADYEQVAFVRTACPFCESTKTKILKTNHKADYVWRLHACKSCRQKFSSAEDLEEAGA